MAHGTVSTAKAKGKQTRMQRFAPRLPYEDFPLFPLIDKGTGTGRWAKKIRQTLHYFGSLADGWEKALEKYQKESDYLQRGVTPPADAEGMTIKTLCDAFYHAKQQRHDAGEITDRTLREYDATCKVLVTGFGRHRPINDLAAQDFAGLRAKLAKRFGPVRMVNEITRVRGVFKFAFDNGLIDRPVRFGSEFNRPSARVLRIHRAEQGERLFTSDEVNALIAAADPQLAAMILLAVNCGLGNADVSMLDRPHVDFDSSTLDFPRPKTGVARRAALWPETVDAIRKAMENRFQPIDDSAADAIFVTKYHQRWVRGEGKNAVAVQFAKLLKAVGIDREGATFYALRHTFRTIADEAGDQRAIDRIMGHQSAHISSAYVERIDDTRLRRVADHVRTWLLGKPAEAKGDTNPTKRRKPKAKAAKPAVNEQGPRLRLVG